MHTPEQIRRLFTVPDHKRPWWEVVTWWEARRIPYNLVVGTAGLLGLLLFIWFNKLPPKLVPEETVEPLSVILFGVGANFFYTAGSIAELVARTVWREKIQDLGPQLLLAGWLFSVMLALFPALASFVGWLWRALGA